MWATPGITPSGRDQIGRPGPAHRGRARSGVISKKLTPSAYFRRSASSAAWSAAIMEVLGHAEIGVTMNTYAHVLPELRQEAADAIDDLFGA